MGEQKSGEDEQRTSRRPWMDLTTWATIVALVLSMLSFYRSYFYINQQLDVTVTEVSYGTNRGELYMTVAFSNGGNRDAAVLRVEPALWARRDKPDPEWVPVIERVAPDIPIVAPRDPAGRQVGRRRGADPVDAAESRRGGEDAAVIAGRRVSRDPRGDDELRRQSVSARASGRPPADRQQGPDRAGRSGDPSHALRFRRSAGGSARRLADAEQADAVRLGRRTLLALAAGPHPRRELTPTPSLGFPCPRSGVAAGASALAAGPHPRRELTPTPSLGFHVLAQVWPQALLHWRRGPHPHRELTLTPSLGSTCLAQVWPQAPYCPPESGASPVRHDLDERLAVQLRDREPGHRDGLVLADRAAIHRALEAVEQPLPGRGIVVERLAGECRPADQAAQVFGRAIELLEVKAYTAA